MLEAVCADEAPPAEDAQVAWSDADQKSLDGALAEVPRDLPSDQRWYRIGALVGKDPDACIARFKAIRHALLLQRGA